MNAIDVCFQCIFQLLTDCSKAFFPSKLSNNITLATHRTTGLCINSHLIHILQTQRFNNLVTDENKKTNLTFCLLRSPLALFHHRTDYICSKLFYSEPAWKQMVLGEQKADLVRMRPCCWQAVDSVYSTLTNNSSALGRHLYPGMPARLKPLISQSAVRTLIICEVMELCCSCLTTSAAAALCYTHIWDLKYLNVPWNNFITPLMWRNACSKGIVNEVLSYLLATERNMVSSVCQNQTCLSL